MSRAVLVVNVLCAVLIAAFLASFVLASLEMSLAAGLRDVADTLWGVVTLADLGVGLVFGACWIAAVERSAARATPWIAGLFLLGNFTTLVYLLARRSRAGSLREMFVPAPPASRR